MTQQVLASSAVTLVDLNDAQQIMSYLSATQPKIQIYDPGTGNYTPDWSKTTAPDGPCVITPSLFIAGNSTDIIGQAKSVTWSVNGTTVNPASPPAGYTVAASSPYALTINQNVLSTTSSIDILCTIVWTDTRNAVDITVQSDIQFSKIQNGSASITGILSNDQAIVPTDSSGNNGIYTGAVTTMSVFIGSVDDSLNWTFSQNVVGLVGTASGNPNGRTFTTTGFVSGSTSGYVDITATKGSTSITKRFTVTESIGGSVGADATSYWLIVDSSAITIQRNNNNLYSPTSINLTAKYQTGANSPSNYLGRFTIEETTDGSNWTTKYTSSTDEATKNYIPTAQATSTITQIRISLYASGGTASLLDQQIVPLVSDGANAVTAFLTNEAQTLGADPNGVVSSYSSAVTTMKVFVGAVDDSPNWAYTAAATNVTGALSTTGSKNIYTVTNLSADSGYVDITATKLGVSVTKRFTLSKSRQGLQATAYWLVSDTVAIKKGTNNLYTPTSINVTGKSQAGINTPANYACRFIIEETTDGSNWVTKYTSSADEATHNYTPTAQATSAIIQVRVTMYLAGGTTSMLDQQIIPIVSDGKIGRAHV